ncbi:MAG: serine hydrolase [Gammaproteobacteria bacterium]|nr:serine hydrolase [Gammaproteobacteria bacterium]
MLFTRLAVMMLVEEGVLDLHADVAGYTRETEVPGFEQLTLAQLMSHRPGYEDTYEQFVQARILDPLGMGATTYSEATARPDQPPLS